MPSINSLPLEILDGIIRELCLCCFPSPTPRIRMERYCFQRGCECNETFEFDQHFMGDLAALSLTSRHLHHQATRHLYHQPLTKRWWQLAATLRARPDLALHVRELHLPFPIPAPPTDRAPELVSYFQTGFDAYVDALPPVDKLFLAASPIIATDHDGVLSNAHNIPVDVFASLCPNLRRLDAGLTDDDEPFRLSQPNSLARLEKAALLGADTMTEGFDFERMSRLFQAAPNLAELVIYRAGECGLLESVAPLTKLTTLEIRYSRMSKQSLAAMLDACPNLENLRFGMRDPRADEVEDDHFTVPAARRVVLEHAPKLKSLSLTLEEDGEWDWDDCSQEEVRRSLKQQGIKFEWED